jgi:sulfur carrier protein
MQISVNGQPMTVTDESTVADLLRRCDLAETACAVEINEDLVPRSTHAERALREGDHVEIVTLVGGG